MIPSAGNRRALLERGDADISYDLPNKDFSELKGNEKLRIISTPYSNGIQYIGMNVKIAPFDNVKVRQAVAYALPYQKIMDAVLFGLAEPMYAAKAGAPLEAKWPHPHQYNTDIAKARQLLAEAGYPNGFRVTLAGPNNRYINDEQVLQTIAQLLARIGIQTRVEAAPMSAFLGRVRKEETSFSLLGWGSFAADLALRSLVAAPNADKGYGAWNWGRYANPKVDGLMEQALGSVDRSKREALAREANTLAMQDLALIPVHHQVVSWAMRANLAYIARTDEFTFAHHFTPR
jgi:peptide/nickel transport system substrate-binding protein